MTNMVSRKIHLFYDILKSNVVCPSQPYKLMFALTYRCNLKCKTCLIWTKEPYKELEFEEIKKFFEKSNNFSWVHLTGGEIFLRKDLPDIIQVLFKYCRRLCLLNIVTNGQLTNEIITVVKEIRRNQNVVLVLTVSIDGPPNTHNMIRGSDVAWDKAVNTFVQVKKLGLKNAYIGYTISQHNIGKLEETFNSIKEKYPKLSYGDIHINYAHNSEHYFNNCAIDFPMQELVKEDLTQFIKNQRGIKAILERCYCDLNHAYFESRHMPIKCQAMRTYCFIDPRGDIYPCSIYNYKIANIKEIDYNLRTLWSHNVTTDTVRKIILKKECPGCWTPCEAYPAMLCSFRQIMRHII